MAGTFALDKLELKRILSSFKVSDANIDSITTQLDKMHKHVNVIMFAEMLQKIGMRQSEIINVLRRAGIDDVTISNVFDSIEENRIRNTYGKLVELSID